MGRCCAAKGQRAVEPTELNRNAVNAGLCRQRRVGAAGRCVRGKRNQRSEPALRCNQAQRRSARINWVKVGQPGSITLTNNAGRYK